MKTIDWDLIRHYTNKDTSRSARVMYSSKGTSNDVERVRDRSWGRVKFTKFTRSSKDRTSGHSTPFKSFGHFLDHPDNFQIVWSFFISPFDFSPYSQTFWILWTLFGSMGHFSDHQEFASAQFFFFTFGLCLSSSIISSIQILEECIIAMC